MTHRELTTALRRATRVFVTSGCSGAPSTIAHGGADDVQHFQVSKAEVRRVLLDGRADLDIEYLALVSESGDLYIG